MKTLCFIRDIYRCISEFEVKFQQEYGLSLNEGMLLCSLDAGKLTSGKIAELLGLTNSNTSKVIRSVEQKKLIRRMTGADDKRQVYFSLTGEGKKRLDGIKCDTIAIPEKLQAIITI